MSKITARIHPVHCNECEEMILKAQNDAENMRVALNKIKDRLQNQTGLYTNKDAIRFCIEDINEALSR